MTLWGVAGYGAGSLTLTPEGQSAIETDIDLAMAAAGCWSRRRPRAGPELAAVTDALGVRTTSAAVRGNAGSGALTPRLEVAVRHDGGDAETGFGLDLGGGVEWSDPARGITAEASACGLLTHEAGGFRDRGLAGALSWDPGQGSDRAPKLTLRQTVGVSATGGMDALLKRGTLAGLANNDGGDELDRRRLEVRLGYGFSAFGDGFTSTPELGLSDTGRDLSLGWRLGLAQGRSGATSLELKLEATRARARPRQCARPRHRVPGHGALVRVRAGTRCRAAGSDDGRLGDRWKLVMDEVSGVREAGRTRTVCGCDDSSPESGYPFGRPVESSGQVRAVLDILAWRAGAEVFSPRPSGASYSRSSSSLTARI